MKKTRKIWTVSYILWKEDDPEGEHDYGNSWFAYGCDKSEAKESFLRYFERERENFYCGDDPDYKISVVNVTPGWSC